MTEQQNKQILSDADLEAVVGGVGGNSIGGMQSMPAFDMSSADIENALVMVQTSRANLLEDQLRQQLDGVFARNASVAEMQNELSYLNQLQATIPDKGSISIDQAREMLATLGSKHAESELLDGNKDGLISKAEVDSLIVNVKGSIDTLGNSQQMDILRLQQLNSKRNEAFEMMTNFMKKMQDARSSIVGNMR